MVEGVTITYQGKVCSPTFEFSRPVGTEPGFGSVFVSLEEFHDYKIEEGLSGVDKLGAGGGDAPSLGKQVVTSFEIVASPGARDNGFERTVVVNTTSRLIEAKAAADARLRTAEKPPTLAIRGWQSAGDLVFSETILNGPAPGTHTVTVKKVLLTERAVESAFAFDDENDLCRVEITDIRYLWAKRGVVFSWVNVPKNAAGLPVEPPAAGSFDPSVGTAGIFILGSTNNGRPWTLRETLERFVLPNLPGDPRINYIASDVAERIPIGHVWNGVPAKKALEDLLKEFQLVLSLDLDSNVSFWKDGEGPGVDKVKLASGSTINVDPTSANCDPRVAHAKRIVSYKWVPSTVVVLGPPIIVTERMKLEAVGEIRGQVVKLKDALEAIGLTMDKAQAFALARYSDRTALPFGVTIDGVREFDRWAFKWFRVPGGAEENADKLPILDGRGAVDVLGQLHPVKVFSETHSVVNIFATKIGQSAAIFARNNLADSASAEDKQDAIARARELLADSASDAEVNQKARQLLIAQGHVTESDKVEAREKARQLLAKADPRGYLVTHNIPFAEQSEGWEIDHARGIVKFRNVQGLCVKDGIELESFMALLAPSAAVELEFSHTLKPRFDENLRADHCYRSVWIRGSGGVAQQLADVPPGTAPLTIERNDFQEVHSVDNVSNRDKLDDLARELAQSVFNVQQSKKGAVATFGRPVDVLCSGQVLSVRWSTENECPRTEVHVSTYPLLSPNPQGRTLAFGLPIQGGRAIDAVFAPRGVKR